MGLYWVKTNLLIKKVYSKYIWDIPNVDHKIYLTFDDGPTPEITEWVLEVLENHQAKATFFCIGNNIKKNPDVYAKVIKYGHSIGNHTFNHLNGWKTATNNYIENVNLCHKELEDRRWKMEAQNLKSKTWNLFRPPYGKIKLSQSIKLRKLGYKIIMWDVLSADFDTKITPKKCLENVLENVKPGSIIVFHDSIKAFPNLEYTLPRALKFWKEKGYLLEVIK